MAVHYPPTYNASRPEPESLVVGVDPSLNSTGYCWGPLSASNIKAGRHKDKSRDDKLVLIAEDLLSYIGTPQPGGLLVVEDMPMGARGAGVTAMAHGVVRMLGRQRGMEVVTVVPACLKKWATDNGSAGKGEMAASLPDHVRMYMSESRASSDAVDAWWLREWGVHLLWERSQNQA